MYRWSLTDFLVGHQILRLKNITRGRHTVRYVQDKRVLQESGSLVPLSFNTDSPFFSWLCVVMLRGRIKRLQKQAVASSKTSLLRVVRSTLPPCNGFEAEAASPPQGRQMTSHTKPKPVPCHRPPSDFWHEIHQRLLFDSLSRWHCNKGFFQISGLPFKWFSADACTGLDMNPPFHLEWDSCLNVLTESQWKPNGLLPL